MTCSDGQNRNIVDANARYNNEHNAARATYVHRHPLLWRQQKMSCIRIMHRRTRRKDNQYPIERQTAITESICATQAKPPYRGLIGFEG